MPSRFGKILLTCATTALISALPFSNAARADLINPTDPALAPFTLTYGDFNVISLQFADTALNTSQYFVASSPGQIRSYVVPLTGAGGTYYNDGTNAMDTPYSAPSGHGAAAYFATGNATSAPDPGGPGQFTGDTSTTWDARLSDLNTALAGGPAVFYFNLNETGTSGLLSGTDLLVWGAVSVVDTTGALPKQTFYLSGNPFDTVNGPGAGKAASILNGGPDATTVPADSTEITSPNVGNPVSYDSTDDRWSVVHGDICVLGSAFQHYGACVNTDAPGTQTIDQNLGANQAAFAFYNTTLDDLISNPCVVGGCYDVIQADIRLTDLDNGYEQIFVASPNSPTTPVPEPSSLAMLGTAFAGAGWWWARRRKPAASL